MALECQASGFAGAGGVAYVARIHGGKPGRIAPAMPHRQGGKKWSGNCDCDFILFFSAVLVKGRRGPDLFQAPVVQLVEYTLAMCAIRVQVPAGAFPPPLLLLLLLLLLLISI